MITYKTWDLIRVPYKTKVCKSFYDKLQTNFYVLNGFYFIEEVNTFFFFRKPVVKVILDSPLLMTESNKTFIMAFGGILDDKISHLEKGYGIPVFTNKLGFDPMLLVFNFIQSLQPTKHKSPQELIFGISDEQTDKNINKYPNIKP